ncbi:protein of unknown function [Magnetospira sp. QH-2]|nr:protein of unknown function [Magnetospira sp. QH-2]
MGRGRSIPMEQVKSADRRWLHNLVASLVTGFGLSVLMLLSILMSSDGTEPRGICEFVKGDAGISAFNPNEGGKNDYSCIPNFLLITFYIMPFGVVFSGMFYILIAFLKTLPSVNLWRTK